MRFLPIGSFSEMDFHSRVRLHYQFNPFFGVSADGQVLSDNIIAEKSGV